jgi:hypothetical protein
MTMNVRAGAAAPSSNAIISLKEQLAAGRHTSPTWGPPYDIGTYGVDIFDNPVRSSSMYSTVLSSISFYFLNRPDQNIELIYLQSTTSFCNKEKHFWRYFSFPRKQSYVVARKKG